MRALFVVLALTALGSLPAHSVPRDEVAPQGEATTLADAQEALRRALAFARESDENSVVTILRPVLEAPGFAALPERERFSILYLYGSALYGLERWMDAHRYVREASSFAFAPAEVWSVRFWAAIRANDVADAIDSLDRLSRQWPGTARGLTEQTISFLIRRSRDLPDADAREEQVLTALRRSAWQSSDPFVEMSYRWRNLARLLLKRGEIEEARAIARDVTSPSAIVGMVVDRRFDAIAPVDANYDFAAAYERDLARRQALTAAHPNMLGGVLDVADLLIALNRGDAALALIEPAIARMEGGEPFEDEDEWAPWVYDYQARALLLLGRVDAAIEAQRRGVERAESGRPNVSQRINLAHLLLRDARAREALEVLEPLRQDLVSPYGWMNANLVRACAQAELGEAEPSRATLAAMRARAADSRRVLIEAELCMNEIDAAAAVFIAALEDEDDRSGMLLDAQTLLENPFPTAFDRRLDDLYRAMYARDDVRRAVERYGRVLTVPIRRGAL